MIPPKDLLKILLTSLALATTAGGSAKVDNTSTAFDPKEGLYSLTRRYQEMQLTTHTACHFGNTDTCSDSTWYHRTRGIYWASVLPMDDFDISKDIKIEIPMPDEVKEKMEANAGKAVTPDGNDD
ncbi:hypothetical protein SCUCBS95973_007322 [Sporothrix curviconia]|uniref:Uncharacterized protein n=1 Tax=Sporothrix curviconia TaxID=1260050 RepID=A0ABP0CF50_9PEZI